MKFQRNELLKDLKTRVEKAINTAQTFKNLSPEQLNFKENTTSWSILECLEHLNLYGDFYLPEIENRMIKGTEVKEAKVFKSGWLGNYFAMSMIPKEDGSIKKMKTFKDKDPASSDLPITTIDRFLKQQKRMLELLKQAQNMDLAKVKTSITISKWLTLKLGDTFRFVIYHNDRHLLQASKVNVVLYSNTSI